jgi:hypothetical protein
MSQRDSGYERKERDLYETPAWVTATLLQDGLRPAERIWEPACGSGKMVSALGVLDAEIIGTDIDTGIDFLQATEPLAQAIITNPPYVLAQEFIEHALRLTAPDGFVAMLLRTDYDHAKTRQHLFGGCPHFARKLVLTKRIKWFEDTKGQPSFNHAWYVWDWLNEGAEPILSYGPRDRVGSSREPST